MISTKPSKTFQYQDELPRLPIPPLEETAAKYLKSIQPLIKGDELVATENKVIDFLKPGGMGEILQKRLKAHDKAQKNSWLEKWWLEYAYHRYREPTLINVNWYCLGKDDPSTPKPFTPDSLAPFSEFQVKRAAHLTHQFLDIWRSIEDQKISPEFAGNSPICMNQYRCMFGMSRIPQMECDKVQGAYPVLSDHITVFVKNHPYYVPVFDRVSGKVHSGAEIEKQLLDVIKDVVKVPVSEGVCLLTAGKRDTWAQAREKLLEISPENSETLNKIQDSIFVVSLDDHPVKDDLQSKKNNLFHGNDANNRWLDAAISLVVDPSGSAGVNGEHSPLDALVPALVLDLSLKTPLGGEAASSGSLPQPIERMQFKTNHEIKNFIEEAKKAIKETIANSNSFAMVYSNYGTTFIKKTAKTSPDAYIQMAIQLAYFNMYGKCVSTYESGSTRKFKHGRTDVIRTLSNESLAFCEAMADNSKDASNCYQALQEAAKAHLQYAAGVSQGLGIDRHFLGLRLCLKPGETHPIFQDPIFAESQSWRLSTSTMFKTDDIIATGFGAVDPDGYGFNYIPSADGNRITFGIESKRSSKVSDTKKFVTRLTEALDQMQKMCEDAAQAMAFQKPSL
ncbi:hypothetical protein DSO57_1028575 [Entomophthora muscae]|uniref:Uncharacterized protein n=1 Tax=Entomophthora muscae TaxID=34485 RepID=A0ACC2S3A3_9FUNG|nr:hypothetical protein DSO57_1028575 [Entomophthora muscae]